MATSMDVGGRTCLSGTAIPLVVNDGECRCLNVVSSAILAGCPSVARVSGDEGSTFLFYRTTYPQKVARFILATKYLQLA